jgi:hypothetical protein
MRMRMHSFFTTQYNIICITIIIGFHFTKRKYTHYQ